MMECWKGRHQLRKVQKQSQIPIYAQLQEIIKEMIDNEELQAHDLIPTEHEFCDYHHVSRMTVRTAIMSLVNEGILYREQGKGTFVAPQKPHYQMSGLKGLTEAMEELGYEVRTKTYSFSYEICSKKIAQIIGVAVGEKALKIRRLRIVDEQPYAMETVWMNPNQYPNIREEMVTNTSLYDVFRDIYQLIPAYTRQVVVPVRLSDAEQEVFALQEEPLGLLFERTTYTEENQVIEYTKSVYRIDKHQFEMYLEI